MVGAIVFFVCMVLSVGGFQMLCFLYEKNRKIYKRLLLVPYVEAVIGIVLCILLFTAEIFDIFLVFLFFMIMPMIHVTIYYCMPYRSEKLPREVGLRFFAFIFGYIAILGVILLWAKHTHNIGSGI